MPFEFAAPCHENRRQDRHRDASDGALVRPSRRHGTDPNGEFGDEEDAGCAAVGSACRGLRWKRVRERGSGAQLKIVGSSTVYPFTTAVAEGYQRANPGSSVIVESTGTGADQAVLRRRRRRNAGHGQRLAPFKKSEYDALRQASASNR